MIVVWISLLFAAAHLLPLLITVAWSLVYNWKPVVGNSLQENIRRSQRDPRQFCNKDSEKLSPVINYDREPTLISQWRKRYKKKLVKTQNNSCREQGGGGNRLYLYFVPYLVKYMEPNDFVLLTSKACKSQHLSQRDADPHPPSAIWEMETISIALLVKAH